MAQIDYAQRLLAVTVILSSSKGDCDRQENRSEARFDELSMLPGWGTLKARLSDFLIDLSIRQGTRLRTR